jgi:hypothetical protein
MSACLDFLKITSLVVTSSAFQWQFNTILLYIHPFRTRKASLFWLILAQECGEMLTFLIASPRNAFRKGSDIC